MGLPAFFPVRRDRRAGPAKASNKFQLTRQRRAAKGGVGASALA